MHKLTTTTSHRQPRRRMRAALPGTIGLLGLVSAVALSLIIPTAGANPSSGRDAQLMRHQGFETGLSGIAPLNAQTQISRVTGGHNDTAYAARLRGPDGKVADVGLTSSTPFATSTKVGLRYAYGVWVRAEGAALSKGPLTVRVTVNETAGQVVKNTAWRQIQLTNTAWQQVRVPLTARQAGRQINIATRVTQLPAGGYLRVDDLAVRENTLFVPPAAQLNGAMFGTSIDEGNVDWLTALRQSDSRFGHLGVVRVFEPGLPGPWSGRLGQLKRPFIYSFRANPAGVVAGQFDNQIRTWFKAAPRTHPIWWTYQHEPEDDIERGDYSADKYRQAWQHIAAIEQSVNNPQLHPTMILMCWTLNPRSGRSFSNYYPGNFIQVLAWDCYNPPQEQGYVRPADLFGPAVRKAHSMGKKFAIAEFASVIKPGDDGTRRARWTASVARYAAAHSAAFVSYWDTQIPGENYQLRDLPSQQTWRSVVSGG